MAKLAGISLAATLLALALAAALVLPTRLDQLPRPLLQQHGAFRSRGRGDEGARERRRVAGHLGERIGLQANDLDLSLDQDGNDHPIRRHDATRPYLTNTILTVSTLPP